MRKTAAIRTLAAIVFASATVLACGKDAARAPEPALTSVTDQPPADASIEESSFTTSDPRITEEVVEGILPSPAETSATLGLAPGAWVLENSGSWGQELEHYDFTDSGIIAGWTAAFVPLLTPAAGATTEGIFLSITFQEMPDQAERSYQFIRGEFEIQPGEGDERETVANAISMIPAYGLVIFRHRTVTAWVSMTHTEDRDVSVGLREFARLLALGIDEFVRSQGP
jgi:hypothetical protein